MNLRLIRLQQVINLTGLKSSAIYKYISEDKFPKSVKLGIRAVAWVEHEILHWIEQRIEHRNDNILFGYDVEV
ncbi:helix-turn-helix transcriptional regulator [Colwelliaceae bacterium 6471]